MYYRRQSSFFCVINIRLLCRETIVYFLCQTITSRVFLGFIMLIIGWFPNSRAIVISWWNAIFFFLILLLYFIIALSVSEFRFILFYTPIIT